MASAGREKEECRHKLEEILRWGRRIESKRREKGPGPIRTLEHREKIRKGKDWGDGFTGESSEGLKLKKEKWNKIKRTVLKSRPRTIMHLAEL